MGALKEARPESGYVRACFAGTLDAAWIDTAPNDFDAIWEACRLAATSRLLVDLCGCTVAAGVGERFDVGVALASHALARMRIAVLSRVEQTTPEHLFETVARNRGADVRVFLDEARAIAWLEDVP